MTAPRSVTRFSTRFARSPVAHRNCDQVTERRDARDGARPGALLNPDRRHRLLFGRRRHRSVDRREKLGTPRQIPRGQIKGRLHLGDHGRGACLMGNVRYENALDMQSAVLH
jgi:hypothetical protein